MRENKIRNERKSEIMDYAMKLFAESGYENTTIEHIAEGLDMDVELCYKYFESKQHLYDMVLETYVDICSEDIIKVFDSKPSIDDSMVTAKFILHGEMSLFNDDKYATDNIQYVQNMIWKILK